ncbi:MAG: cobalt transporter [Pseudomonadales bacterium]|nr:cobalt transporter [Pseudomonadales bacterium]
MTQTATQTATQSQAQRRESTLTQTMASLGFGAMVLFAVGFLPIDAAHNAAHDTRHALAFPCH